MKWSLRLSPLSTVSIGVSLSLVTLSFGAILVGACVSSGTVANSPPAGPDADLGGGDAATSGADASGSSDASNGSDAAADAGTADTGAPVADGGTDAADGGGSSPAPGIYVTNYGTNAVVVFAAGADADAGPLRTISGAATGLSGPIGLAVDALGYAYVANRSGGNVTVYAPLATGNAAPVRTLTATGMLSPEGLALGAAGDVFVSTCPQCGGGSGDTGVYHFPSGASAADRTLGGATNTNTGLTAPSAVALDDQGNFWVGNSLGGNVSLFAAGATGDVAPLQSFVPPASNLQAITYGAGTVFVIDPTTGVLEFGAADAGASPASTIPLSTFPITYPAGILLDTGASPPTLDIVDFGANALVIAQTSGAPPNLSVTSSTTISGSATTLDQPLRMVVVH